MRYVTSIEQMAKAEGKAEDKAEGKAEGRLATQTTIALNMLRIGIPLETIAECTELTLDQLLNLQRTLQ